EHEVRTCAAELDPLRTDRRDHGCGSGGGSGPEAGCDAGPGGAGASDSCESLVPSRNASSSEDDCGASSWSTTRSDAANSPIAAASAPNTSARSGPRCSSVAPCCCSAVVSVAICGLLTRTQVRAYRATNSDTDESAIS